MKPRPGVWSVLFLAVVGLLAGALYRSEQQQVRTQVESLAFHAMHAAEGLQVVPKDPGDTYERYRALFNLRTFRREAAGLAGWGGVTFDPVGRVGSAPDPTYGAFSHETYIALSDTLKRAEAQLKELGARPGFLGRARVWAVLKEIDTAIVAAEKPRSAALVLYSAILEGDVTRTPWYADGKVGSVDRATVDQVRLGRLPDLSDPFGLLSPGRWNRLGGEYSGAILSRAGDRTAPGFSQQTFGPFLRRCH